MMRLACTSPQCCSKYGSMPGKGLAIDHPPSPSHSAARLILPACHKKTDSFRRRPANVPPCLASACAKTIHFSTEATSKRRNPEETLDGEPMDGYQRSNAPAHGGPR